MREAGDNDVLETAFFDLGKDRLLVLDGVAAKLTNCALTDRIIENEKI